MLTSFPQAQPLMGLLGGLCIGLSAAIMLLALGRIAGVSGLTARAVGLSDSGVARPIALAFLIGLPLGALIVQALTGAVDLTFPSSPITLIAGGLIVGFGTRMGSGCTSGHGVCGMSRLSRRSIIATMTFIVSGIATVAVMNALGMAW